MKLINTTPHSNRFLRRLISWACRELDLPVRYVKQAKFRNRRVSYSGHARPYLRRICVSTKTTDFDSLAYVTIHELAHLRNAREGCSRPDLWKSESGRERSLANGGSEQMTEWFTRPILAKFKANRKALLADWSAEPVAALRAVKPSVVQVRAKRATDNLKCWQTKARLAATKVRKYKRQVAYYVKRKPR